MGVRERLVNSRAGEAVRPVSNFGGLQLENFTPNSKSLEVTSPVESEVPSLNSDFYVREDEESEGSSEKPKKAKCYSPKLKSEGALGMSISTSGFMIPAQTGDASPTLNKWKRYSAAAYQVHSDGSHLFHEGKCLFQDGFYSRANVYFTKAVELQDLPEYLSARSMCWLRLDEPALALQDSMKAIEGARRNIEKYLAGDKKRSRAKFLEYYYRRGLCFAKQGGVMGSQLALHDFKVATTQSNKLGFWVGTDPEGWSEKRLAVIEEYDDESAQIAELDEEERLEYEQDREPIDKILDRSRLGIVLDEVTELKTSVSQEMADSDEYAFTANWKAMHMNHRTDDLLLPLSITNYESLAKIFKGIESGKLLHCADLFGLLGHVKTKLQPLDNIVKITIPDGASCKVIGDIHGQLHDLLHILQITGMPSEHNIIIFNGDFVDRGAYGVECVTVLLLLKVAYPEYFHVVRGNHEDHAVNEQYHFLAEVLLKYGSCDLYHAIQAVFKMMPLAHLIDEKIFVVHGGIPGPDTTLEEILALNRETDVPETGPMANMLWSDPWDEPGEGSSARGRGVLFGEDFTKAFLEKNNLELVVRSHDVTACMDNGYAKTHDGKCITIFSAPNYCNSYGNKAAILNVDQHHDPWYTTFGSTLPPSDILGKVCLSISFHSRCTLCMGSTKLRFSTFQLLFSLSNGMITFHKPFSMKTVAGLLPTLTIFYVHRESHSSQSTFFYNLAKEETPSSPFHLQQAPHPYHFSFK